MPGVPLLSSIAVACPKLSVAIIVRLAEVSSKVPSVVLKSTLMPVITLPKTSVIVAVIYDLPRYAGIDVGLAVNEI